MTFDDLIAASEASIARHEKRIAEGLPSMGSPVVQLVLPGYARGETRRLAGRSGPVGEVLCDNVIDGKECSVVNFKAADVLKWAKGKKVEADK